MEQECKVFTVTVGEFIQSNCYLVGIPRSQAFIIDPGADADKIKAVIREQKFNPLFIINTHGHIDHIQEDTAFDLPIYIHKLDAPFLRDPGLNLSSLFAGSFSIQQGERNIVEVQEGQSIEFSGDYLKIIHTPGHTPGGICIKFKDYLFTGDTLFCGSIGRTDLQGGDSGLLVSAIKNKLFKLDDNLLVFPGHGPGTTLKEEKENNFFLKS